MLDDNQQTAPRIPRHEHLRKEMKRLGFDQTSLADALGISRQVVNYLVNDKQAPSPQVGGALSNVMRLPPGYWFQDTYFDIPAHDQAKWVSKPSDATQIVRILVDHQIESAVADGLIDISPFERANLKQASLDLTLGNDAIDMGGQRIRLADPNAPALLPGQSILVTTQETINLKNRMIGRVAGSTHYTRQGIVVFQGLHIDPGFNSTLQFLVSNLGLKPVTLEPGMALLSMELHTLAETPDRKFDQEEQTFEETVNLLSLAPSVRRLWQALEPHLTRKVEAREVGASFQAGIPGLMEHPVRYRTAKQAKGRYLEALREALSHAVTHDDLEGRHEILSSIRHFAEGVILDSDDAWIAFENLGFELNTDGMAVCSGTGKKLSPSILPTGDAMCTLWGLFEGLRLVESLELPCDAPRNVNYLDI